MIGFRAWIPPVPFAAGIAFQGVAWGLVLLDAERPSAGLRLAWIHAVALGWLTLTATAVLLHAAPAFTDLRWRGAGPARAATGLLLVGAAGLVAGLAANAGTTVAAAGALAAAAILVYVGAALVTLAAAAPDRASRAIARALMLTLLALALTALLGAGLARAYAAHDGRLLGLAPAHAWLGIGAWLSVLVTGVSQRTFRPMLGVAPGGTAGHIVVGSGLAIGSLLAAVGSVASPALLQLGALVAALGALTYVGSVLRALVAADTPNPVARAFVAASAGWLGLAAGGAVATAWGVPLAAPVVVVALAGWLGQMVNAHLHHLGVRLIATLLRGDDDETRPWVALTPALGWASFAAAQLAVAATAWRAAGGPAEAGLLGGSAGLAATACLMANGARAVSRLLPTPRSG